MNQMPDWNTADKAGSLKRWIAALNEEARRNFLESGTHVELFFIFNDEGLAELVPIVGMEKDEVVRQLRALLDERNGYAFIHIAEAVAERVDSGESNDMLLVHAESRDGLSRAWCSNVVMQGENKMLLDAVEVDGSHLDGRFIGLFDSA